MTGQLPPLRLTGALSLRDGVLQRRSVCLQDGRFTTGPLPSVDLGGFYLMPGIIDLCAALPGHGAAEPPDDLPSIDAEAASRGVTTCYLVLRWTWESSRAAPRAARLARQLAEYGARAMTDLRAHLVCERRMTADTAALIELVRGAGVGLVSFSDDAARASDLRATDAMAFAEFASTRGTTPAALSAALDSVLGNSAQVPRHLCRLAEAFDREGVIYGSIGDATAECREHHSMIGARLCHDPRSAQVAAAAHAVGDPVIADAGDAANPAADAPRPSTLALIQSGLCDALVSGGNGGSLVQAAFRLADLGILPLERSWHLVSSAPAAILRLPDRGTIAPGKRADLAVINADTRQVEATIRAGRLTFLTGAAAGRFHAVDPVARFAAQ